MASITFQPGSVPIETLNNTPGQQPTPGAPTTNPNNAQSSPAPQDTVVLTGKVSETVLTSENQNSQQFQQAVQLLSVRPVFLGQGAEVGSASAAPPAAPAQPDVQSATQTVSQAGAAAAPANSADPAIAAAIAANSQSEAASGNGTDPAGGSASGGTPQQQLANLDQTLQRLGINPQSISLASRMGMLLYANDPAALRVMIKQIQSGQQTIMTGLAENQATQGASQTNALQNVGQAPPASANQAQSKNQTATADQVQAQNANLAAGTPFEFAVAQFTLNQPQGTIQQNSSSGNDTTTKTAASAQTSTTTMQAEELPLTLSQFANGSSQPTGQHSGASSNEQGQTLNVTA